jgi:hypothetical protein
MSNRHSSPVGAKLKYGDADCLFPVDELYAADLRHRDAHLALENVKEPNVIVVVPTSLATSYFLTQHPLTVIPVDDLSPRIQTQISASLESPLDTFELIQIGRWNNDSPNHSLAEFTVG